MSIKFTAKGNLENNHLFSAKELIENFGYNKQRLNYLKSIFELALLLKNLGCKELYVVGSFVTTKAIPNDIDVCINFSDIDENKLAKSELASLDKYELARIKQQKNVHLIIFDNSSRDFLDWFRQDRDGNKRGIIQINIKDLDIYDKERETI